MELTNQYVTADANISSANVIKLMEHLLNHGHILSRVS
jgi:hypothetical protein